MHFAKKQNVHFLYNMVKLFTKKENIHEQNSERGFDV